MDISFKQKKLQKTVSDEVKLGKAYGSLRRIRPNASEHAGASKNACRCAAHSSCEEAQAGVEERRVFAFAVDVKSKDDPLRIEFEVANVPVPLKEDGSLDFEAVTEIEITQISNHYKK